MAPQNENDVSIVVEVIPCLHDNYAYVVFDEASREAVVIDPSESAPILRRLDELGLQVVRLLATHHHADHVGGAVELARNFNVGLLLHETDAARLAHLAVGLEAARDGDEFTFHGARLELLHVPGHTLGAAAFVVHQVASIPWLFTGDTLFLGGCGRVFEGTPGMLRESVERLAALAEDALVYCGHEYTVANLQFARTVEPLNASTSEALDRARAQSCTVPGRLSVERAVNPFLRSGAKDVRAFAQARTADAADADRVFAELRLAKNGFVAR